MTKAKCDRSLVERPADLPDNLGGVTTGAIDKRVKLEIPQSDRS